MIETVSQLAMAFLLDRFLVMLQGRARFVQGLCPVLFLAVYSQLECFFLVWKIVVWLGHEMVIVDLVYLLGRRRRGMYHGLTRLHSTLPSLLRFHALWCCLCLRVLVSRLHFFAPSAAEGFEFGLIFRCWLVVHSECFVGV